ncbi:DegT/DnrJ/EryC1/StrS aminotransferase family protein [Candidatus Woesearchaeota archaeon]|nr:DegT/DnrJ/EryC1/StrS aminotransferase family protein [Candidatus Woesearchaeota archaeon]
MAQKEAVKKCEKALKELTGKKHVLFVQRGNVAIRQALRLAKRLGYKRVLIQDQGGWMTYKHFCKKEKLPCIELKTSFGLLDPSELDDYLDSALLINSMPGYAALQDMKAIMRACKERNMLVINDASGSIGTPQAEKGDIILASFAKDKPVNILGHGGFVASDNPEFIRIMKKGAPPFDIDFPELLKRLGGLRKRLDHYRVIRSRVLDDLKDYDIIHRNRQGINVIARFYSEMERERLINYCSQENLEFTVCPRDIRVKVDAISFEIKRK